MKSCIKDEALEGLHREGGGGNHVHSFRALGEASCDTRLFDLASPSIFLKSNSKKHGYSTTNHHPCISAVHSPRADEHTGSSQRVILEVDG